MTDSPNEKIEKSRYGILNRWVGDVFDYFGARSDRERLILTISAAFAMGYWEFLAILHRVWFIDASGHPIPRDFVAFWTAGRQVLSGAALAAYDPGLEHAAEAATIGHHLGNALGWWYPPLFLFVAAALASLPYVVAFLGWTISTLLLHAAVVRRITGARIGFVAALAAPWVLPVIWVGQNGFFTAAILGAILLNLERRPMLSGILLGLLSYKPQLGVLFPLALAAGGYWRAFGWAALATIGWNVLALAAFGASTFVAFVHAMSFAANLHFVNNPEEWSFLQSPYGFVRTLGGSGQVAWSIQALVSLSAALAVVLSWRAAIPFALKAALICAGMTLAIPHIFVVDFPVLTIALAFVYRDGAFDRVELWLLTASAVCVFGFFLFPPLPLFASIAIAGITVRRVLAAIPRAGLAAS